MADGFESRCLKKALCQHHTGGSSRLQRSPHQHRSDTKAKWSKQDRHKRYPQGKCSSQPWKDEFTGTLCVYDGGKGRVLELG